jgi:hypothetical protein
MQGLLWLKDCKGFPCMPNTNATSALSWKTKSCFSSSDCSVRTRIHQRHRDCVKEAQAVALSQQNIYPLEGGTARQKCWHVAALTEMLGDLGEVGVERPGWVDTDSMESSSADEAELVDEGVDLEASASSLIEQHDRPKTAPLGCNKCLA